jgi:hypothetical protein
MMMNDEIQGSSQPALAHVRRRVSLPPRMRMRMRFPGEGAAANDWPHAHTLPHGDRRGKQSYQSVSDTGLSRPKNKIKSKAKAADFLQTSQA